MASLLHELKQKTRGTVHSTMSLLARYAADNADPGVDVSARRHLSRVDQGQSDFGEDIYAVREEQSPAIIYRLADVSPTRGGVFRFEDGKAYRVERTMADGEYGTAECIEMSESQAAAYPMPGGA